MSTWFKSSKTGNATSGTKTAEDPPRRTPTDSSYYDCHGVVNHVKDPNARSWHYARDVRAQVQAAGPPASSPAKGRYPSDYWNHGNEVPNLSVPKPYMHVPINPGQTKPFQRPTPSGAHRAVYNDNDRAKVDVIYHDPNKPIPAGSKFRPFSKADYVPKASTAAATHQPARR
ncbi:uncharacterized protein APUU_60037A [Aspergillus puulaauensis]|uniref:Uncharacterized protein n=1 Tax=Aspergillus puulaauensis TaxID=1220207 RepID=A0A7R7XT23_9EURO|nr:uncharacterized protein APUU_60037A [Aspergillus puulaauensis]BCS26989.1 hypothetical protein APUU_60037A [Aspergillus puulaauensis]